MKNKEFLDFIEHRDYFIVFNPHVLGLHISSVSGAKYSGYIYDIDKHILFEFDLCLSKRNIRFIRFDYAVVSDMKYKPTELKEWSPALFLPCTNYFTLLCYLEMSLKVYLHENHLLNKLLSF